MKTPTCHFKEMEFYSADDGYARVEHWWECSICGHTKEDSHSVNGSEI